jgi:anthranilate phosphoribosyltransferase
MQTMTSADSQAQSVMRACIGKIATGPEYSKALSLDEAYAAMRFILEGKADPVQSGVFLIALRMKRETDDENVGALRAIMDMTRTACAAVAEVVDIAEPYDGYARCLPISPFLPAVLAACGVPAVSHGLEKVAPKNGITHRKVLRAAGVDVDLEPEQAADRLNDPDVGWAYVDQSIFCPALHNLVGLRRLIVKRPVISTVENLTGPVRGCSRTHLITGYVHRAYPPFYARLARAAGFASAALVRGTEGGVLPSLRQAAKVYVYDGEGELRLWEPDPSVIGIDQATRAVPLPEHLAALSEQETDAGIDANAVAETAAEAGLAALDGAAGAARDSLIYGGALVLAHLGRTQDMHEAAAAVRAKLDSGAVCMHLRAR